MANQRADPALSTHLDEVVPYWVATLAAGVCRAYGVPPTGATMSAIIEESYETAFRLFAADLAARGRISKKPAAKVAEDDNTADNGGEGK